MYSSCPKTGACAISLLPALGVLYHFPCYRWLSRDEDDGQIERDLFPGEEEHHDQDVHYTAEVYTSDLRGAGTDADVSLVLFGHLGDSGTQHLNVSCECQL